ncbi:MAG: hypothetical protein A2053_02345 [Deltaproteobacteria bacterium GWA2_50_8]|nr:MAG: hypothetical protein A2053_02345 [Deltaproteobacteria bacterium GWA2_50_8]
MKIRRNVKRKNQKSHTKSFVNFSSLKRILVYGVGGGCLLSLLVLAGDYIRKNPPHFFDIREIIVSKSTPHLNEFDILKLTEVKIGDDLLTLSLSEMKEKMERYLWIKEVHLLKRYPHRLYIKVEEHQPMAVIDIDGLYLINKEGEIFKKMASTDPKNFPVITGMSQKGLQKNKLGSHVYLSQALELLHVASREKIIREYGISEIHWDSTEGFTLYSMRPVTQIKIGKENFEKKFKKFAKAWPFIAITSDSPKIVDLTYERRVIVQFKTS